MNIWTQVIRSFKLVSRQDDNPKIPEPCYDLCNNVYIEAQHAGKTPLLCEDGSAYRDYYDSCNDCLITTGNSTIRDLKEFGDIIQYCDSLPAPSRSLGSTSLASTSLASTSSQSSLPHITVTTTFFQQTSVNGVATVLPSVVTLESFPPIPSIATIEISVLDSTGGTTLQAVLTTLVPLPITYIQRPSTTQAIATTEHSGIPTSTSPPPSPPSLTSSGTTSKAWIAGPVVGSVAAAAVLLILGFVVGKKRRARTRPREDTESPNRTKTELHVTYPPTELPLNNSAIELPLTYPPMELPTNEANEYTGRQTR